MPDLKINNKLNVMIVEDDEIYRESLQLSINESSNLVCQHACLSCETALELLKKGFVPQVILLDVQLPGISGIEGIQEIKMISPSTAIIMLTVFDDDDKIFNAICRGASGYLLKSSSSHQIHQAIEQVVCEGAAISPTIASKILTMFTEYAQPKQDYGLTTREKEILKLLVDGLNKKQAAHQLHISQHTIDTHLKNIYAKLHVHSQIEVVSKTLKEHLI